MRCAHRRRDRGQAAVEFAIALPLVVIVLLGVVQVVVIVRDQLAVELAARAGARAAAAAADPAGAAADAARASTGLRPLDVSTVESGGRVTVAVTHSNATNVPIVGAFISDVTVRATATMAVEPP